MPINKAAIIDASFVAPNKLVVPDTTHQLIDWVRQNGLQPIFVGNECQWTPEDYRSHMRKSGIPLRCDDLFYNGAMNMMDSAEIHQQECGVHIVENRGGALSRECAERDMRYVLLTEDTKAEKINAPQRVYIGHLSSFTSEHVRVLLELIHTKNVDLIVTNCNGKVSDQRDPQHLLYGSLTGNIHNPVIAQKLSNWDLHHHEIAEKFSFGRSSAEHQYIVAVTQDSEIYKLASRLAEQYTSKNNRLFYIRNPEVDTREQMNSNVHATDEVDSMKEVLEQLTAQ